MRKFLTWWVFLVSYSALAQNITISARVVDAETKEALLFATVGIQGQSLGTITNQEGDFDFHIPSTMLNEIFVIRMLGYENYQVPVWNLINNSTQVIEMQKSTQYLQEVVVSDSLTGGDILHLSLAKIPQNYPMNPFMLDGFYRDLKEVSGTHISLLEAAVKIYDDDYEEPRNKNKLHERVALEEVRRSLGYENKFTTYFDEGNLLGDLLMHNNIKYRNFPKEEIFFENLKRGKDTHYNGKSVFVVTNNHEYLLRIYVDKQTFGIIHLEYENNEVVPIKKRKGLISKFVSVKRVIDFKFYENKLFLNYLSVDSKINWYNLHTDDLQFKTALRQELLINNVHQNSENRIRSTEKMKDYGLQYQDRPYNKEFWDNYNMIKESPLDQAIVNDLEKEIPLEKQFEEF